MLRSIVFFFVGALPAYYLFSLQWNAFLIGAFWALLVLRIAPAFR